MERQQLPELGISLNIPKGFTLMDDEMRKTKYPYEGGPSIVFSDATRDINIAINAGAVPMSVEQVNDYKIAVTSAMSSYQASAESVTIDGGRKAWIIGVTSKAMDTDIRNIIMVTSFRDKLTIVAFNCPQEQWDTYKDSAKAALLSIKFDDK
ncbi:hypothetical protein [Leminorella grimontii]|uniref:hypothetical protein n=1 Tax=Leminorella grimontii TaxID=82981 RepID=UPI00208091AB|nr:hypothetical protein [Leminorella grimontii]GKX61160.1 hypothetical protein SOASR031_34750 [Leminorella grimontii]